MDLTNIDDVLLDMDGTLLDLRFDNWLWLEELPRAIAAAHHVPLTVVMEHIAAFKAETAGTLRWYSIEAWGECFNFDVAALHRQYISRTMMLPEVIAVIRHFRKHCKRVGIVTNACSTVLFQKRMHMDPFFRLFDFAVSTEELGYPKEDIRCWNALDSWLTASGGAPINRARALFADDTRKVLWSLDQAGFDERNLVYIRKPDSTKNTRPEDLVYRSVEGLHQLIR